MRDLVGIVVVIFILFVFCKVNGQSHGWTVNPADYSYSGDVTSVVYLGTDLVTTGTLAAFVNGVCRGYEDGVLSFTGKTVFMVMCYSNMSRGEKLTFKYFNPSGNLTYSINETIEFESDMIIGNALTPIEFHITNTSLENIKRDNNEEMGLHTYPNPFSQHLNIEYRIHETSDVRLSVFDAFGRMIHGLVDQKQHPDHYSIKWDSYIQPDGIYIVKFEAGAHQRIHKVILIR